MLRRRLGEGVDYGKKVRSLKANTGRSTVMKMPVRGRYRGAVSPPGCQWPIISSLMWVLLVLFIVIPVDAFRLTNMTVPKIIDYRDNLELDCRFDMGVEELYAVKWYKDDHEFFRFVPLPKPAKILYTTPGITVNKEASHCDLESCHVRLVNLRTNETGGSYRCEISSEAPTFRLASETHNVTIASIPTENPTLTNVENSYFQGDILSIGCHSAASYPPQDLTWYIDDVQVPDTSLRQVRLSPPTEMGLYVRSLQLRFIIDSTYSKTDSITVKCVSTFPELKEPAFTVSRVLTMFNHDRQMANNQKFSWSSCSRPNKLSIYITIFLAATRRHFH